VPVIVKPSEVLVVGLQSIGDRKIAGRLAVGQELRIALRVVFLLSSSDEYYPFNAIVHSVKLLLTCSKKQSLSVSQNHTTYAFSTWMMWRSRIGTCFKTIPPRDVPMKMTYLSVSCKFKLISIGNICGVESSDLLGWLLDRRETRGTLPPF